MGAREGNGTAGVTKSWRSSSKKCGSIAKSPWLELSNEPQYYCKTQQHAFNLSFEEVGCYWWHGKRRPRYDPWKHFHYYSPWSIVEGEKILIDYCFLNSTSGMVDKVEVFKLQIEDLSSLKLDNIGDRALFAGINCCMSVPASQVGCRNNRVYFTHRPIDGWRLYDMRSGCISPCYEDSGSEIKNPVWEQPIAGKSSRR
ncbi:hypothetical protein HAX54_012877 [Datura stramonium]|uniref:KIB1-4 beta-propeller domain-containing protein n=1 Tax=Datura stramonium TaxID=4076 RepID=A0ABS8RXR0_DATST|nr:hypothetical protein [Datura stramonium]